MTKIMTQSIDFLEPSSSSNNYDLEAILEKAASIIAPVWPLKNAIACNPLLHLEAYPFWDAILESQKAFHHSSSPQDDTINFHLITWLQAFLDEQIASIKMPCKEWGFFAAFKQLIMHDKNIMTSNQQLHLLKKIPSNPKEAISYLIDYLGIKTEDLEPVFRHQLSRLPGWGGYIRWLSQWQSSNNKQQDIDLFHIVAARLTLCAVIFHKIEIPHYKNTLALKQDIQNKQSMILKLEQDFIRSLTMKLEKNVIKSPTFSNIQAQFVFCIDVRSEQIRKVIENQNNYQTFGFAGFFGIATAFFNSNNSWASCPVLLSPVFQVHTSFPKHLNLKKQASFLFKKLKFSFGTAFALVETLGVISGLWMAIKTFFPRLYKRLQPSQSHMSDWQINSETIGFNDKLSIAENALKMMGLFENFAKIVMICGHGSESTNNPWASSLECGACGGNPGGLNAKLLASILNEPSIRQSLTQKGIAIPSSTLFVGALHNTVTHEITILDKSSFAFDFSEIEKDLQQAKTELQAMQNAGKHMNQLFESKTPSHDWACIRPEWGLARNGAFIIGPREVTKNLDLEGRCFLHSYQSNHDIDGKYLETILTAPVVVAEWINMQYFFSLFDPVAYGSGSKVTHNIVGGFGVMQGNFSDLMHGLPSQSIFSQPKISYHEAIRLHVIVYAPLSKVDKIIQKHDLLKKLFLNQWAKIIVIDDNLKWHLTAQGQWKDGCF